MSLLIAALILDKLGCVLIDKEIKMPIFDLGLVLPSNVALVLRLMEP